MQHVRMPETQLEAAAEGLFFFLVAGSLLIGIIALDNHIPNLLILSGLFWLAAALCLFIYDPDRA